MLTLPEGKGTPFAKWHDHLQVKGTIHAHPYKVGGLDSSKRMTA